MLNLARRAVRWRLPARWWLFAVGSPAVLAGAAVLAMAIGPGAPELGASSRMGLPGWGMLFVWLVFVVVNGLGEETGWREYALPLLRRRHGTLAASLLLVPKGQAGTCHCYSCCRATATDLGLVGDTSHLACSPLVELSAWCLQRRDQARSRPGFVDSFDLVVAPGSSAARLAARNVSGADARPRVPDGFWSSELGP